MFKADILFKVSPWILKYPRMMSRITCNISRNFEEFGKTQESSNLILPSASLASFTISLGESTDATGLKQLGKEGPPFVGILLN